MAFEGTALVNSRRAGRQPGNDSGIDSEGHEVTDPRHEALEQVRRFLEQLDDSEAGPEDLFRQPSWWREGQGWVTLGPEEAPKYRECVHEVRRRFGADESISRKAVERFLVDAIFEVLDVPGERQDRTHPQRVSDAVETLRKTLTDPRTAYRIYHPVLGLSDDGLPFQFGSVDLRPFDADVRAELEELQADLRKRKRALLSDHILEELTGQHLAAVEVHAVDSTAALWLARKEVELTLDVLNFFSDLTPYNHSWLSMPGRHVPGTSVTPLLVKSDDPVLSYNTRRVGPLGLFSMEKLTAADAKYNLGLNFASTLLKGRQEGPEGRLVAALRWAGRAAGEQRRDVAFLLFIIALESVLLTDGSQHELSYRLRLRAAHLIGTDLERREKVFLRLGRLYQTRSTIVHTGEHDVSEEDLADARRYCKIALLTLLREGATGGEMRIQNFPTWARQQLLST